MAATANDQLARYFTEKLWDWIPGVYRDADAAADHQNVLRALIQAIAEQAAVARRSIDRLWEDQSIEFCDDQIVPYIGALVGTRLVPALNARARRVDVSRTIYYRRRAGTVTVLEQLIVDMAGWDGAVVEAFRRLGRTRHMLDPRPGRGGRYTGTPAGGVVDLRHPRGAELAHGPWDEFSHTADLWQHRGHTGRYGIPKLNHHLYRMQAYKVEGPTPFKYSDQRFTFDPSGRDIPLYMPAFRPEGECHQRREWDVAGPIRCRLLGHAEYLISREVLAKMKLALGAPAYAELADYEGVRFRDEHRLRATLATLTNWAPIVNSGSFNALLAAALTEDSAKATLVRDARAFEITYLNGPNHVQIAPESTFAGNLAGWGTGVTVPPGKLLMVDPVRGRYWFPDAVPPAGTRVAHYHYGFPGDIGATNHDRRASVLTDVDGTFSGGTFIAPLVWGEVYTFTDSATYILDNGPSFNRLTLQAASQERPYLRQDAADGQDWTLTATGADAELTLEGLWYGGGKLILAGNYKRVTIRQCTLDPGGLRAETVTISSAELVVQGSIAELIIDRSILPGISVATGGAVASLQLRDSIVASFDPLVKLTLPRTEMTIERSTLAVETTGLRLYATEVLAQRPVTVTDNQNGCVRFSVLDPQSRTTSPYPGLLAPVFAHFFQSTRFGDPGFYVLSESAPDFVTRGAENGSEVGAYSRLLNPLKLDSLRTKVHEFMPMGRLAAFIREN